MEVGVRELKSGLSEYLRRAVAGDHIIVTDHGKPIARVVPYIAESEVERGIDEGWIEGPRRTRLADANPVRSPRSTIQELDEDRG